MKAAQNQSVLSINMELVLKLQQEICLVTYKWPSGNLHQEIFFSSWKFDAQPKNAYRIDKVAIEANNKANPETNK